MLSLWSCFFEPRHLLDNSASSGRVEHGTLFAYLEAPTRAAPSPDGSAGCRALLALRRGTKYMIKPP
jgi:hypothetical protein